MWIRLFLKEKLSYKQPMISSVLIEKSDTIEIIYPDILFIDFIPVFSERALEVLKIYEPAMIVKQVNFIEGAGEIDKEKNVIRADFAESFLKRRLKGITLKNMEVV